MAEALPDWAPKGVDPSAVSVARVYDYYLGGTYNFDVDREVARHVLQLVPEIQEIVQANRAFLHRAVRYLVDQGIRQFIDLGSGIPSVGNVHETAQQAAPGCRVLYVDHDPTAVAQSAHLLRHNLDARIQQGDLLDPESVLAAADFIDFTEPVGLLMVSVLHFFDDRVRPLDVISQYQDRLAPGSHLAITHVSSDANHPEQDRISQVYASSANPITLRTREQIVELLNGWDAVAPGAVWVPQWHPDEPVGEIDPSATGLIAVVGRKP